MNPEQAKLMFESVEIRKLAETNFIMNRSEASKALGKVFAYLACNKRNDARTWAKQLIRWLETI